MSDFLFHLVRDGKIVRSARAADIAAARGLLGWREGSGAQVVSDASWRLPMPGVLKQGRCTSCGIRPATHQQTRRCDLCEVLIRNERAAARGARQRGHFGRPRNHRRSA